MIAVVGSTGILGGEIVTRLRARGKPVRGLMLGVAHGFGDQPPPPEGFADRMTTVRDYARHAAQSVRS